MKRIAAKHGTRATFPGIGWFSRKSEKKVEARSLERDSACTRAAHTTRAFRVYPATCGSISPSLSLSQGLPRLDPRARSSGRCAAAEVKRALYEAVTADKVSTRARLDSRYIPPARRGLIPLLHPSGCSERPDGAIRTHVSLSARSSFSHSRGGCTRFFFLSRHTVYSMPFNALVFVRGAEWYRKFPRYGCGMRVRMDGS